MNTHDPIVSASQFAFLDSVKPNVESLRYADVERVRAQINLCQALAKATGEWADDVQLEMRQDVNAYKAKPPRVAIAQSLLDKFLACNVHSSLDDFSAKVSEHDFNLSKPLLIHYHQHGNAPASTRIVSFMRAMSGFGNTQALRLRSENPTLTVTDFTA